MNAPGLAWTRCVETPGIEEAREQREAEDNPKDDERVMKECVCVETRDKVNM